MLHEKLETAQRQTRQRWLRYGLIAAGSTAAIALFLLGIVTVDLSRLGFGSPKVETAEPVVQPTAKQTTTAADTAATPAPARPKAVPDPGRQTATVTGASADEASQEARKQFKQELAAFEEQLEPEITTDAFGNWNSEKKREILELRDQAVSEFSRSEYQAALASVTQAGTLARQELTARDTAFNRALSQAENAFAEDNYESALSEITEALRLKPQSAEAQELQQAIERLPPLLDLIEKAAIARTENNLEAEERHLKAVLAADPTRRDLAARLETVSTEIRERAFSQHIAQGMAAIEGRDLSSAYNSLKEARALYDGRPEARLLSKQAANLARELEFEKLMSQAHAASGADNWVEASGYFQQARDLYPDNDEAIAGYGLSAKIAGLSGELAKHLHSPERLAADNVAKIVRDLLDQAIPLSRLSPSLKQKVERTAGLLEAYAVKVQVRVVSDGETNISVRGVGRVGKTEDKTISLKPGRHTFEGIREGYRAKLIEVQIPPGAEGLTVEIFCDERI